MQAPKTGPNKFRLSSLGVPKFSSPQVPELAVPPVPPETSKPPVSAGETGLLFDLDRPVSPAQAIRPAKQVEPANSVKSGAAETGAIRATPAATGSAAASRPGRWSRELPFLRMYSSNAKRRGPQNESAWEDVRVARNDLSEADFEVVARRGKTTAGPFTLESVGGPAPRGGAGWMGLVRRLVGWGSKRS